MAQDIIPVNRVASKGASKNKPTAISSIPVTESTSDAKPNKEANPVSGRAPRASENAVAGPSNRRSNRKPTQESTSHVGDADDDVTPVESPTKKAKIDIIDLTMDGEYSCVCNCTERSG